MRIRIVSTEQIRQFDRTAIHNVGIPSIALMENAGRAVALEVVRRLEKVSTRKQRVLIVCGVGNNAGDGFVCARHLLVMGARVSILIVGDVRKFSDDAKVFYRAARNLNIPIINDDGASKSRQIMKRSSLIVDAIFGVGLNREISDPFETVIDLINQSDAFVISVDVPSGLDATTGRIYNVCVRADVTVTFSFAKKGFYREQGPQYVGEVVVADIGIPRKILK